MQPTHAVPLLAALTLLLPLVYAGGAILPTRATGVDEATRLLRRAERVSGVALLVAGLLVVGHALTGAPPSVWSPAPGIPGIRVDGMSAVALATITTIGFVVLQFSRTYLDGDPGAAPYARRMLAALAAVTTLVSADNLVVIGVAWLASSVAVHGLLLHFPDRAAARSAAWKKFVVSRLADVAWLAAAGLIFSATGTVSLAGIEVALGQDPARPVSLQAAALLVVLGVGLKSAQLPFHGWLTQVMEAPTPVSALLHAGVINLGGIVLIRLAPLMEGAPAAQTLLVAWGAITAVAAGLVATTRVTIKVMLAWSTIAQMGFMLVQCGLGAYDLALLHLVAHSFYKAHAFLTSGSTLERWRAMQLAPRSVRPSPAHWAGGAALAIAGVMGIGWAAGARVSLDPALPALGWMLALALGPSLASGLARPATLPRMALGGALVAGVWFGWHALLAAPPPLPGRADLSARVAIVIALFGVGYALQAALLSRPEGIVGQALYPRLFRGFSFDELFTRLASPFVRDRAVPADGRGPLHSADLQERP